MDVMTKDKQAIEHVINCSADPGLIEFTDTNNMTTEFVDLDLKHVLSLFQFGQVNAPVIEDKNDELRLLAYGISAVECSLSRLRCVVSKSALLEKTSTYTELKRMKLVTYPVYSELKPLVAECINKGIGCYVSRVHSLDRATDKFFTQQVSCYFKPADNSAKLYALTDRGLISVKFSLFGLLYKLTPKSNRVFTIEDWSYCGVEMLKKLI